MSRRLPKLDDPSTQHAIDEPNAAGVGFFKFT